MLTANLERADRVQTFWLDPQWTVGITPWRGYQRGRQNEMTNPVGRGGEVLIVATRRSPKSCRRCAESCWRSFSQGRPLALIRPFLTRKLGAAAGRLRFTA